MTTPRMPGGGGSPFPLNMEGDDMSEWNFDMDAAPRDGTEINGYRPDQGVFTCRWASMDELVPKDQNGDPTEDYNEFEWWWHDRWGWMERELTPTAWRHLPTPPPPLTRKASE